MFSQLLIPKNGLGCCTCAPIRIDIDFDIDTIIPCV
jgi:hypothetical protein